MENREEIVVSVIIPAHNAAAFLKQAIDSALDQKGGFGLEVIVIDDASTDATEEIVAGYPAKWDTPEGIRSICYLKNEQNQGVAETRNKGIRNAAGKYIAFLDADDWWEQGKLQKQLALMEEKKAVLCGTGRLLVHADGSSTGKQIEVPDEITYEMLLRTNSITCSSAVLLTEVAREFYMCHDELHEDYILWLKVLQKYRKAYGINEPLVNCRQSEGGKSRNKWKSAKMHFGVYRYMKIGCLRSCYYMIHYIWNGIRKYH